MPSPDNIIIRLRPASGRAVDIAAALALADEAAIQQQAIVDRAKAARDDALLDAEPATLRKAEQTLADAREQGERVSAVRANLATRLAAAQEGETVAHVATLRAEAEATDQALSAWWVKTRRHLATELGIGLSLLNAAGSARREHDREVVSVSARYPEHVFPYPANPKVDAGSWPYALQSAAMMADTFPNTFAGLLTAGDPKPPGTF